MTKRLVDIDDDLLERARSVAGTDTIKATVDTALQQLVDHERVLRHLERLRGTGALDLQRIEQARRPRPEAAGLSVLHYDDDYDRIAKVTGQPTEWIAPAGSLDR